MKTNALQDLCEKYGHRNLTFKLKSRPIRTLFGLIAYSTSSDEEVEVSSYITEARYQILEGYKVTLTPMAPGFPDEHFYQSDLISMIRRGSVKVEDPDGNPIDLK